MDIIGYLHLFQVKFWNTFNEAALFCTSGFSAGHAPRLWSPGVGEYLCSHHVLLSHARAYHLYHKQYYAQFKGKIGIALNSGHAWPRDPNSRLDVEAAERSNQFQVQNSYHIVKSTCYKNISSTVGYVRSSHLQ